ncbi:MAG: HEAT repeat domain-containing protein [Terriglobales bacterium]
MNKTDFDSLFDRKDWTAVEVAQQSGPAIVPYIEPHLKDKDEVVRLLAVDCLDAAGGPQAAVSLVHALSDSDEQVRNNAVNALHRNLPFGHEAALMAAWDASRSGDSYLRQQIPLVLGLMGAQDRLQELKARLAMDHRQTVRDGIITGAAKLGDRDARTMFGQLLRDARGKRTAELMEFVKYLNEPWVIPQLVPVLQRKDVAVVLSTHINDVIRRECDLATDEVLRISKVRFSFAANPGGQYKDEQINEVLRFAQTQPGV